MFTTVQITKPAGTVFPHPTLLANTLLTLQVELSVCRTIGQTLSGFFVELGAVGTLPPLLADARPVHAEPVPGASRVGTIN
jgi:hypothetical protein